MILQTFNSLMWVFFYGWDVFLINYLMCSWYKIAFQYSSHVTIQRCINWDTLVRSYDMKCTVNQKKIRWLKNKCCDEMTRTNSNDNLKRILKKNWMMNPVLRHIIYTILNSLPAGLTGKLCTNYLYYCSNLDMCQLQCIIYKSFVN